MKSIFPLIILLCSSCTIERGGILRNHPDAAISAMAYTPNGELPDSGTSYFEGTASIVGGPFNLEGSISLALDFDLLDFRGKVSNVTDGKTVLSGQLDVKNGNLCRCANPSQQYSFDGLLVGNLSNGGTYISIDTMLAGNFFGPNGEFLSGDIYGHASNVASHVQVSGTFAAKE